MYKIFLPQFKKIVGGHDDSIIRYNKIKRRQLLRTTLLRLTINSFQNFSSLDVPQNKIIKISDIKISLYQ